MRETKLYENIVAMYEKRLSELQAKLTQFDGDVDELRKSHPDSILLEWASDQKAGIQKQIEEYNVELARNRELIKGSVSGTARGIGPDIWPNKYSYITRIPELLRFYLSEVGGGPVKIDKLIHDVTKGGAKVYSRRPRKGEDRSEPRPLVRSDITKLFSDLRSGYEKQKTDSPFAMDGDLDTVRLVPMEERQKEQVKPRQKLTPLDLDEALKASLERMEHENAERKAKRA